jgi:hypothetical protein
MEDLVKAWTILLTGLLFAACTPNSTPSPSKQPPQTPSPSGPAFAAHQGFMESAAAALAPMLPSSENEFYSDVEDTLGARFPRLSCTGQIYINGYIASGSEIRRVQLYTRSGGAQPEVTLKADPEKQCRDADGRVFFKLFNKRYLVFPKDTLYPLRTPEGEIVYEDGSKDTEKCTITEPSYSLYHSPFKPPELKPVAGETDKKDGWDIPHTFQEAEKFCAQHGQRLPTARELALLQVSNAYDQQLVSELSTPESHWEKASVTPAALENNPLCPDLKIELPQFDLMTVINPGEKWDYFYFDYPWLPKFKEFYWTASVAVQRDNVNNTVTRHHVIFNPQTARFNFEKAPVNGSGKWIVQCVAAGT